MTESSKPNRAKLSGRVRPCVTVLGLGLLVPLVVACLLEPDGQGRGTHGQLGLPPCTFVVLFGQPCPVCGMTTSWAHLVRGEVIDALGANVGGTLLGVLDLATAGWLLLSAACGRWLGWVPNGTAAAWLGTSIAIVILINWAVRLMTG